MVALSNNLSLKLEPQVVQDRDTQIGLGPDLNQETSLDQKSLIPDSAPPLYPALRSPNYNLTEVAGLNLAREEISVQPDITVGGPTSSQIFEIKEEYLLQQLQAATLGTELVNSPDEAQVLTEIDAKRIEEEKFIQAGILAPLAAPEIAAERIESLTRRHREEEAISFQTAA